MKHNRSFPVVEYIHVQMVASWLNPWERSSMWVNSQWMAAFTVTNIKVWRPEYHASSFTPEKLPFEMLDEGKIIYEVADHTWLSLNPLGTNTVRWFTNAEGKKDDYTRLFVTQLKQANYGDPSQLVLSSNALHRIWVNQYQSFTSCSEDFPVLGYRCRFDFGDWISVFAGHSFTSYVYCIVFNKEHIPRLEVNYTNHRYACNSAEITHWNSRVQGDLMIFVRPNYALLVEAYPHQNMFRLTIISHADFKRRCAILKWSDTFPYSYQHRKKAAVIAFDGCYLFVAVDDQAFETLDIFEGRQSQLFQAFALVYHPFWNRQRFCRRLPLSERIFVCSRSHRQSENQISSMNIDVLASANMLYVPKGDNC